jgi:flavin-dependent dehydrogenase
VPDRQFDIAIVGAGPAGSSAAIRLAAAGLKVVLIEKSRFPRQKLCGEFVSPECFRHLDTLGVLPDVTRLGSKIDRTVFYSRSGRSISVESRWFGVGYEAVGISRAELDLLLMERARSTGVEVLENTVVSGPIVQNEVVVGVTAKTARGAETIRAALTIDATGRSRIVSRKFDEKQQKPDLVAFKAHLSGAQIDSGSCEIYSFEGGYGGCNRVEGGVYNLCFIVKSSIARRIGSDPDAILKAVVYGNPRAAAVLRPAKTVNDWLAITISQFGRGKLAPAKGLLCIGDAAAFIDPFTGSGILMALESSAILSNCIVENWEEDNAIDRIAAVYSERHSEAFNRRLALCSAIRYAAFMPTVAETVIAALSLSKTLRRSVARATRFSAGPAA